MRRGFSLIEMLILLALTALLMSILLPSLALGRERARGLKCQSNLRQLGIIRYGAFVTWGNSPYDFSDDESGTSHGGKNGINRRDDMPGNEVDPTRAKDSKGEIRSDVDHGFTWQMEHAAEGEPRDFPLACPSAEVELDENSFGIYYRAIERSFEYVQSHLVPMPIVYGCSEYRVVDAVRSLDYRHSEQASVLMNDMSVRLQRLEHFPSEMIEEPSNR